MKICLTSQEYPPASGGGIATQTHYKATGLSARGHEIHVVSISKDQQTHVERDGEAFVHRIPGPDPGIPTHELSTWWMAYSMAVARKVNELDQQVKFDIIHFPEYGGEGFVYQTEGFSYRRAKFTVQLHGPLGMFVDHLDWPEPDSTLAQVGCFMERMSMRLTDGLMASSHCTAKLCAARYGLDVSKIAVVHSALDTQRFAPRPGPCDERSPRILFTGNLAGNKGLPMLVDVVLELRHRYPGIALRAIGWGDQDQVAALRRKVSAAGAEANVELRGYTPYHELPQQYAWCDFYAGPSVFEGGPGNVYLEAMACARPVIACTSGGVPEVVLHERTGLLIPPRDAAGLREAIVALADDGALRQRLGRQGREWIEERFTAERYIDRVESIYRQVLGG